MAKNSQYILLLILQVRNSWRVWLVSSHLGSLMRLQSNVGGAAVNRVYLGWTSNMARSQGWHLISVALSTTIPMQGFLSLASAFLQQGGLRIVGFLTWQLTVLNTSVPVTKVKAALEFTQCLFGWIVLVVSESLSPAQIQMEGIEGPLLVEKSLKDLWPYVKAPKTTLCVIQIIWETTWKA